MGVSAPGVSAPPASVAALSVEAAAEMLGGRGRSDDSNLSHDTYGAVHLYTEEFE